MRRVTALALLFVAAGIGCSRKPGLSTIGPPDGGDAADAGIDADGGIDGGSTDAGPSVVVSDGRLVVDGVPMTMLGAELQYFRMRDPAFDAAKTKAIWNQTLDQFAAANLTLVTTYLAWDYHSPAQGQWDFTGARDIDAFLGTVCARGFKVFARPGPLITGEWPKGPGSFGAVPTWWKDAHPEALALKPDGSPFNFSVSASRGLKNDPTQVQPSYLHPAYLSAVGDWFDQVVPVMKKYIDQRCIIGVQIDNETNLYWAERFGEVDYSRGALAHYSSFLQTRYGTVAALNAAYGTSYSAFDFVVPPTVAPPANAWNQDVPARDWYDAGQALVLDYLKMLRGMLEQRGITEPQILFLTNDSPFGLPLRNVLLHNGPIKNQVGLAGVDTYPKVSPLNGDLLDNPFQVDHAVKTFGEYNRLYTHDKTGSPFVFGAELQGGYFNFPLGITPNVRPEVTDQVLAKSFGHGMRVGSVYVFRGGLNMDGSTYDFLASVGPDGSLRPRYDVLSAWGRMVRDDHIAEGDSVEDPIAILIDSEYQAPQSHTKEDMQSFWATEMPGIFGWLADAGFNPVLLDARLHPDLSPYRVVFFPCPQFVADDTARMLRAFHDKGGVLVGMLDPGQRGLDGKPSSAVSNLSLLYGGTPDGGWDWVGTGLRSGASNAKLSPNPGPTTTYWYTTFWIPPAGANAFLMERNGVGGWDMKTIGYDYQWTIAPVAFIGTYLSSVYNSNAYYGAGIDDLDRKRTIARYLAALGGVSPKIHAAGIREQAWARRLRDGTLLVFVVNSHAFGLVHVAFDDPPALGMTAASYSIRDARSGTSYGIKTTASLNSAGFDVPMADWGTAVLVLKPVP